MFQRCHSAMVPHALPGMLNAQSIAGQGRQLCRRLRLALQRHSPSVVLLSAAAAGNGRAVRWLLRHANSSNNAQTQALLLAAMRGHDSVLAALLTPPGKADVLAKDRHGRTALHFALIGKHSKCMELLVAAGAAIDAVDNCTLRAWLNAIQDGGALSRQPVLKARQLAAAAGADVSLLLKTLSDGSTLLHCFAAMPGCQSVPDTECIRLARVLIDLGADVNKAATDGPWHGATPLHAAAQTGNEGMLQLLLSAGADVDAQCNDGTTAAHLAAQCSQEGAVQVLAAAGARLNAQDANGETPLLHASRWGSDHVVKALLEAGANLYTFNSHLKTPLHLAARGGKLSTVQLLLQYGADAGATDQYDEPALSEALKCGNAETAKLLAGVLVKADGMAAASVAARAAEDGRFDQFVMVMKELGKHHPESISNLLVHVGFCGPDVAAAFSAVVHSWVSESSESEIQQQREELAAERRAVQHLIVAAAGMGKRLLEQQQGSSSQPAAKKRKG